jgi:aminoglycoside phosphotransferase (APT) family kinase protein
MLDEEEARLAAELASLTGAEVISLRRQARWRKAWFATVRSEGRERDLYIRGDKQLDAEPYPGLDREARIMALFEENGLPVPHLYGMTNDPIGIVMDSVPGTRDVAQAADDAERQRLAEDYIAVLARMHRLDVAPFVAAGIEKPEGPRAIALSYLTPHLPLYRRTKRSPQPMIEWALRWVERNVPENRDRACVIHGDPGQFLFENGSLTCIHDFEATHIGDPMHDLAALRLREGTEPLGANTDHLIRHYAKLTGEPIDGPALSFHTAAFMLAAVMSLAGPLTEPKLADMQLEYLIWDVMCRRAMLYGMAEVMGITIPTEPDVVAPDSRDAILWRVLDATIDRIDTDGNPVATADRAAARTLAEWGRIEACSAVYYAERDLDRAAAILGYRPGDWRECDLALEQFVQNAGPEHDAVLFDYFTRQVESRVAQTGSVQRRLAHYALQPLQPGEAAV